MTVVQKDTAKAAALGRNMREDRTVDLSRRRKAVGFCLAGMASLGMITLYQTGIFKRLPDPPLPGFDAEKVNGSAQAYRFLSVPDAVLGIGSYAVTLGLLAMSGAERAIKHPWIPIAAAAKTGVDALLSTKLATDQVTKSRAVSLWSLIVAATTLATLASVIPEAADAVGRLSQ